MHGLWRKVRWKEGLRLIWGTELGSQDDKSATNRDRTGSRKQCVWEDDEYDYGLLSLICM